MHQDARTLEMREKRVTEADTVARTLDQTGHVGDGQLCSVRRLYGAEHRLERRERVVGHLGRRVRDAAQERRLARVRKPCERSVGHQFQAKLERMLLARHPRLGEARRLPGRRREARVAPSTAAAARHDDASTRTREVRDEPAVVPRHLGPDRHGELDRRAVRAVLPGASAVPAPRGGEEPPAAQRRQVPERRVGDERHVAAAAAVPAVRPTPRDVLLATEAERAVTAASRADDDAGSVVEHAAPEAAAERLPASGLDGCRDRDRAPLAAAMELDDARAEGEERVVAADADARTRTEAGAALADDDHPGLDLLPREDLHAEPLAGRVATVLGGAEPLLVCHLALLLCGRGLESGDGALALAVRLL